MELKVKEVIKAKALGTSVSDLLDEERLEEDQNTITCPKCGTKFKMEE